MDRGTRRTLAARRVVVVEGTDDVPVDVLLPVPADRVEHPVVRDRVLGAEVVRAHVGSPHHEDRREQGQRHLLIESRHVPLEVGTAHLRLEVLDLVVVLRIRLVAAHRRALVGKDHHAAVPQVGQDRFHEDVALDRLIADSDLVFVRGTTDRHRLAEALIVPVGEQVHERREEPRLERGLQETLAVVVSVLHEQRIPVRVGDGNVLTEVTDPVVHLELRLGPALARCRSLDGLPLDAGILGHQILDLVQSDPTTLYVVLPLQDVGREAGPERLGLGADEAVPDPLHLLGEERPHLRVFALDVPVHLMHHEGQQRERAVDLVVRQHAAEVVEREPRRIEGDCATTGEAHDLVLLACPLAVPLTQLRWPELLVLEVRAADRLAVGAKKSCAHRRSPRRSDGVGKDRRLPPVFGGTGACNPEPL